jgi:serine/threonine protein kinase
MDAEVRSLLNGACRHASINQLVGVVRNADGRVAKLVLELATEGSLDQYLVRVKADPARHHELTLPHVVGWMIDSVTGVWHLHHSMEHPLLHRDLKPQNLLVTASATASTGTPPGQSVPCVSSCSISGGGDAGAGAGVGPYLYPRRPLVVKLGDFGVARPLTRLLTVATASGNLFAAAPEVSHSGYRAPADVYSWAVTMCWAVVQVSPGCMSCAVLGWVGWAGLCVCCAV